MYSVLCTQPVQVAAVVRMRHLSTLYSVAADTVAPSSVDVLGGAVGVMAAHLSASAGSGDTASVMDTCALAVMVLQVGEGVGGGRG